MESMTTSETDSLLADSETMYRISTQELARMGLSPEKRACRRCRREEKGARSH